ncbi:TIM barrel protein [bacterium]|nr:TIM barrel protein [bacterium]
MDKLNFLTAGIPASAKKSSYEEGLKVLDELGLDGLEVEFVRGVRISDVSREVLIKNSKDYVFTAHAPFFINLNAKEQDKVDASIRRILETAEVTNDFGGYSIVFHAAYYLGDDKEKTYNTVKEKLALICSQLEEKNNKIWIRPETTGKATQWGDLDEIIKISNEFAQVLPCVDFAHLHARSNGEFNAYDDFCMILERIGTEIGSYALNNFHAHVAGIAYGAKGEKHHLNFEEADMNYKDLARAFKSFDVKGVVVCESPNIEVDTNILKEYYNSL